MDDLAALDVEVVDLLRRHGLLESLVRSSLLRETLGGVPLDAAEEKAAVEHFCRQNRIASENELSNFLAAKALSQEELLWNAALPLRVKHYSEKEFSHKAEARFLDRKQQLDRVIYSLLRVQDPFLARELYLRIAEGEASFAELASSYSEGQEKSTKGIVGPVPLMQAHPKLAELLRTSQPGELREPLMIDQWHLVVRLENYTPANLDQEMAAQMATELFEQWVKDETELRLRHLLHAVGKRSQVR